MSEGSNPRVVFLFPGALGDLLLALPTLRLLRRRHAGAHTTLAVSGWLVGVAAHIEAADEHASLDDADAAGLFGGARLPHWFVTGSVVYAWLGRSDPALRRHLGDLASRVVLLSVVKGDATEHAAITYARQAGFDPPQEEVVAAARLRPRPSVRAAELLACVGRPLLVVHSGAGARAKRWPFVGFVAVASAWRAAGGDVVHLVGPAEPESPAIEGANQVDDWGISDVVALLAGADGYIGNDSGISHLAAALGARGVALFGPTAARRWRPLGEGIVAVEGNAAPGASLSFDDIPVARVLDALRTATRLP